VINELNNILLTNKNARSFKISEGHIKLIFRFLKKVQAPGFLADLTTKTLFRNSEETSGACQPTESTPEVPFDYGA
jgi:hypothetical protein